MSTQPKILVTSAAGKTGLQVTLQLSEKGFPVRALGYSKAAVSQLAIYAGEYRRGTFAVSAPRPQGRLRGLANFAKILVTPALDTHQTMRQRDYPMLANPAFSQEADEWGA